MKLNVITAVLLFGLSGFLVATGANGEEIPITFKETIIGSMSEAKIESANADRIVVSISINFEFDRAIKAFDNYLKKRGDFIKGCSKRLYWAGGTKIREAGKILKLSSRVRYEQWTCTKIFGKRLKTRLFRDTKTVHWQLRFDKKEWKIIAHLENIKKFPGSLEKWFGLKFKKEIDIPVPQNCGKCPCEETFQPKLKRSNFSQSSDGNVVLDLAVSFENDLVRVAQCFSK